MKTQLSPKNMWLECDIEQLVVDGIIFKPLDGNHGGIHPKSEDFVQEGIPFVMASDIYNSAVDLVNSNFISKKQADGLKKGFSIEGDVLLTHKGSVGGTAIVPKIYTDYIMLTPQVTYYRVRDKSKLNNYFLFSYFQSSKFQAYIKSVSGGGTRAYIGITAQLSLPFILPPLPEQNRIVAVLETWDQAIQKLTRNIEKKRNIKTALMQELLTGKTRLLQFTDRWKCKKLGEVSLVKKGDSITKKDVTSGDVPVIAGGQQPAYYHNKSNRTGKTITVSASGAYAGYVDFYNQPIFVSDCTSIKEKDINIDFIYLYLKLKQQYIYSLQSGGAQPHVQPKDLSVIKIFVPESKEEQYAIAKILTTADKEIQTLEHKLKILKEQKRYLLNNLITGAIRTPESLLVNPTK